MTPRWSVIATMADSSRANFRSASSLSERLSASSVSKGRSPIGVASCRVLSLIVGLRPSGGGFRRGLVLRCGAFELLESVAQLVARDAEEFGGACLVTIASL